MKPCFLNCENYTLRQNMAETIRQGKPIYHVRMDENAPLMYYDGARKLQTRKEYDSDLGSIPDALEAIPGLSSDDWEMAYLFHDDGCNQGGLWSRGEFVTFTRREMDDLLRQMVLVESEMKKRTWTGIFAAPLIWVGVRVGAWLGIGTPRK